MPRANQLAHHLRSRRRTGRPGRLCLTRSLEMIVGLLGILKAGGAYLPLDPALPPERLAVMLGDSGARLLVTQERWRSLPLGAGGWSAWTRCRPIAAASAAEPPTSRRKGDLAYVLYTSGSTGRPKGVAIEHRPLVPTCGRCSSAWSAGRGQLRPGLHLLRRPRQHGRSSRRCAPAAACT